MEEQISSVGIAEIVIAVSVILGLVLGIAKVVVKLTPTTKDDAFVRKVAGLLDPIIAAMSGKSNSKKG